MGVAGGETRASQWNYGANLTHRGRLWQVYRKKINPTAQPFVPNTSAETAAGISENGECDFACPLPHGCTKPFKVAEQYSKKMERWKSMDEDEFCYVGDPFPEPLDNKVDEEKKKSAPSQHKSFPYHNTNPRPPMTDEQHKAALKN
jgi:hypothetical protein